MLPTREIVIVLILIFSVTNVDGFSQGFSDEFARIDSINMLAAGMNRQKNPLMLEYAVRAVAQSKKVNYVKGLADAYYNIGDFYYYSFKKDSALYYFNLSSNIAEVVNYNLGKAKCEYSIAHILFEIDKYDDALFFAQRAILMLEELQDSVNLAKALNLGCEIYSYKGENERAIEFCIQCIELFDQLGDPNGKANALNVIGNIYTQLEIYEKAEKHLHEALKLALEYNNIEQQSVSYNTLGGMHYAKNDYENALMNYKRAYEIDFTVKDTVGLAYSSFSMGKTFVGLSEPDTAIHFLDGSLVLSGMLQDKDLQANAFAMLGKAFHLKGRIRDALEFYQKSLDLAVEINAYPILHTVHKILAEFHEQAGHPELALKFYRLFMDYDNKLKAEANARRVAEVDAIYELKLKERRIEFLTKENEIQQLRARERELINKSLWVSIVFTLLVAGVLFSRNRIKNKANKALERQKQAIHQQKEEIEQQRDDIQQKSLALTEFNKQITYSIEYARWIQLSLFPSQVELKNIFPESFIFNKPRDIISGDFYWVAMLDDKVYLAVVDCTGHGVPGAFITILASSLLNQIILENRIICPNMVLSLLDIKVKQNLHVNEGSPLISDGMDIGLCVFNREERTVEFAGAKFNFFYADGKILRQVSGNRYPIGSTMFPEKSFTSSLIKLPPNTTCYLATDGFQDQFGGLNDTKFMKPKFKKMLKTMMAYPIEEQYNYLSETFTTWKGDNPQTDDILILGIKL